jgi:excisionase family DNA binding protein
MTTSGSGRLMTRNELAPRLLKVAQPAEALRVGDATIRGAIARGELAAVKIGKPLWVPVSEVERLEDLKRRP